MFVVLYVQHISTKSQPCPEEFIDFSFSTERQKVGEDKRCYLYFTW